MTVNLQRGVQWTITFPKSPKFSLTLVDAEVHQQEEMHDTLKLKFRGALTKGKNNSVKVGHPVKFTWKSGPSTATFIGFVQSVDKNTTAGNTFTTVNCINNSNKFKTTSKKVYKKLTADRIATAIAKKHKFKAVTSTHPLVNKNLPQSGQSDWQFLRQLAKKTGFALRAENDILIFKSRDKIISEKLKNVPKFIHFNEAPMGAASQQTLIQFTASDSNPSPEVGQGDSGVNIYGPDGKEYSFNAGYKTTSGLVITDETDPSDVWGLDFAIDAPKYVSSGTTPNPTPEAGATFNITSYGATNASGDCTNAIKAAFAAAKSYSESHSNTRVEVYIPKGTWNINTRKGHTLKVFSNLTVKAEPTSIIKNHGTSYMLMSDDLSYSMTEYNGPQNVIIDGGIWDATLKARGMTLIHCQDLTIKNVTIKDHTGNGHGIEINSSKDVLIENCKLLGVRNAGGGKAPRDMDEAIQLDFAWDGSAYATGNDGTPCLNVTIKNCYFGASGTPGSTYWPRAIGGHKNKYDSNRHSNVLIQNNTIVGCNGTGGGAIRFFNMRNVTIDGNNISNCYRAISGYIQEKPWPEGSIAPSKLDNITITDNTIDNCGSWKSHDSTNSYPAIDLNVKAGTSSYFEDVVISGNSITNHHGNDEGIKIQDTHTVTINHNYVPNRHCGSDKGNMIATSSSSGVTVTKNRPDNS